MSGYKQGWQQHSAAELQSKARAGYLKGRADDLYVIACVDLVSESHLLVKIGRSTAPNWRVKEIGAGLPLAFTIVATMSGGGDLEHAFHSALRTAKVKNGLGTEWFALPHSVVEVMVTTWSPQETKTAMAATKSVGACELRYQPVLATRKRTR